MENKLTDKELIKGCISGSREIRTLFVSKFSDPIFRTIQHYLKSRSVTHSQADIEDLHNSVFVSLLENRCKKLSQFRGDNGCSLNSWVCLIAVRTAIDSLRKRNRDVLSESIDLTILEEISGTITDQLNPETLVEKDEDRRRLLKVVSTLKPKEKLLIRLHCFKEFSVKETAKIMDITETNAFVIKHRAIKKLKAVMKKKRNISAIKT